MENNKMKNDLKQGAVAAIDYAKELAGKETHISELRLELRRKETEVAVLSDRVAELESRIRYSNKKY